MPTLEEYFANSEQYDVEDMDRIPEETRKEINAQLELASSPQDEEPEAK